MSDINKEFDLFIGELLSLAIEEFESTEQCKLIEEKLGKMYSECGTIQQEFATECFDLIWDAVSQEEHYVYRKGFRDCVCLLKALGVLA